jgi:thymidylate synthase
MINKSTILVMAMLGATPAHACWESDSRPVVLVENAFTLCEDIASSIDTLVTKLLDTSSQNDNSINPLGSDYWDEWAMTSTPETPILTQSIQQHAIGLGFWLPQELADQDDLDYVDWIQNQGVLLSIGLGDKSSDEPRMRFDYQWHDEYEDTFHVQLEFPIN